MDSSKRFWIDKETKMKRKNGFTLIELMIVVAFRLPPSAGPGPLKRLPSPRPFPPKRRKRKARHGDRE